MTGIVCRDVSKFYGEVLGINRVDLTLKPGITSLVGPNGSGKTTLLNLLTGLIRPTRGTISVLGMSPAQPRMLFRKLGYCAQIDAFPEGMTALAFIESLLWVHGYRARAARRAAMAALDTLGLAQVADRRPAAFSKGMRQRLKLAQAIAHDPRVLLLDEPLNGLDPMARADVIGLFRSFAAAGRYLVLSSHILHEVDLLSDEVVMLQHGYVVAEGAPGGIRDDLDDRPRALQIRCARAQALARALWEEDHVAEVRLHRDRAGLLVHTLDADRLYAQLNRLAVDAGLVPESVRPADVDMGALYDYLIDEGGRAS